MNILPLLSYLQLYNGSTDSTHKTTHFFRHLQQPPMLFNSKGFALFLPLIFIVHWWLASRNVKYQNRLLLAASIYFYGSWSRLFLLILLFSALFNFLGGLMLHSAQKYRKTALYLMIAGNLAVLSFFKYNDFFIDSFVQFLTGLGIETHLTILRFALPVGISFYTFHSLSYIIDLYKGNVTPEKSFTDYALFVGFFPLLVAGPIERATHLIPQLKKKRIFNYKDSVDGLRQFLWGLFKKAVIADHCGIYADQIFTAPETYAGSTLVLGAVFFAFQIYCDFSGYSDMAIGTARLFGISLLRNFSFPYFSRNIAEFWRRWHISLTSWFRDYLYIPLGGSRAGRSKTIINTFIVFIVSGIWHGSGWTFVVWGVLNALLFLPLLLTGNHRNYTEIVAKGRRLPSLTDALKIMSTFGLTLICWIFFRADNLQHAWDYLSGIFTISLFTLPEIFPVYLLLTLTGCIAIEWAGREDNHALETTGLRWKKGWRYAFYYAMVILIMWYSGEDQTFIYFQF